MRDFDSAPFRLIHAAMSCGRSHKCTIAVKPRGWRSEEVVGKNAGAKGGVVYDLLHR